MILLKWLQEDAHFKRIRDPLDQEPAKTPEKIQVSKEDLAELSQTEQPNVENPAIEENQDDQGDVSLEEVSESENQASEVNSEDSDTSNS